MPSIDSTFTTEIMGYTNYISSSEYIERAFNIFQHEINFSLFMLVCHFFSYLFIYLFFLCNTGLETNNGTRMYLILLYRSISNCSHILMHIKMKKLRKIQQNLVMSSHQWTQPTIKIQTNLALMQVIPRKGRTRTRNITGPLLPLALFTISS